MSENFEQRNKDLLASGVTGHDLIEGLKAIDAERAEAAAPIYPTGDVPLDARRSARPRRSGSAPSVTSIAGRWSLPCQRYLPSPVESPPRWSPRATPASRACRPRRRGRTRRELAATMVDLQSFRPDDEATAILAEPGDAGRVWKHVTGSSPPGPRSSPGSATT